MFSLFNMERLILMRINNAAAPVLEPHDLLLRSDL